MTGKQGLSPGKAEHFYRDFEARFRGSAEEIKRRLGFYEPFVADLREITNVDKVLDLGSRLITSS